MHSRAVNTEMESLLEHAQWVQELAYKLVRDPSLADDIVQETWVAALSERSEPVHSTRAWLAMVVKRLVWQRYRSESRRRSREEFTARSEATASTGEIFERVSAHKQVVEAVTSLPETYRTVLLRRYFEGETPTEIAKAQGVPISTVKTRLQRGLARLREELDENNGKDGSSWALALAPLARAHELGLKTTAVSTSSIAMPIAWAVGASLLVALAASLVFENSQVENDQFEHASLPAEAENAGSRTEPGINGIRVEKRTSLGPLGAAADKLADQALVASRRVIQGKVLSASGASMAFVLLEFQPRLKLKSVGEVIAISDENGLFSMRGASGAGVIRTGRDDLVTICAAEVGTSETPTELNVIVAEKRRLAGHIFDDAGNALSEARVEFMLPAELRASLGRRLETATPYHPITESDTRGFFVLPEAAQFTGAEIHVRREGFLDWRAEPGPADENLRIILERVLLAAETKAVRGRVLDASGAPMIDVRVALDGLATRTDRSGAFALPWDGERVVTQPRLVAVAPGRAPAFALASSDGSAGWNWPNPLELRLEEAPLSIAGHVLDHEGLPRAGVLLWLAAPSLLSLPRGGVEEGSLTFGLPPDDQISAQELPQVAECVAQGNRHRPWTSVRSDADGRFKLSGLGRRSYRIATLDPATLATSELGPVEAGASDVVLRLDRARLLPQLTGRVVDPNGAPLAGIRVNLSRGAEELRHEGKSLLTRTHQVEGTRTDRDGRFLLRNVPPNGTQLILRSPNTIPQSVPVADLVQDQIELTAMPDTRMRVELADVTDATAFELLDANNAVLPILIEHGTEWRLSQRTRLPGGRSEIVRVPLCASSLRLWKEETLVHEVSIKLEPGRVNLVSL